MPSYWNDVPRSITANLQTVEAGCAEYATAAVVVSGTYAGVNLTFEASVNDGGTWVTVQAVQADANTVVTATGALTSTTRGYKLNVSPFNRVRVRTTAYTSGTMVVVWSCALAPGEPVPSTQSHAITGTVTTAPAAGVLLIGDVSAGVRTTATNALLGYHLVSAASTNAAVVKASAGRLYGWSLLNTAASPRYVKLHNTATTPTAGTGVVRTIAIPTGGLAQLILPHGHSFATGIGITAVTEAADNGTTGIGANEVVGELWYA